MDTQELYRRGLAIRKEIFGTEAVDKRMAALGDSASNNAHRIALETFAEKGIT